MMDLFGGSPSMYMVKKAGWIFFQMREMYYTFFWPQQGHAFYFWTLISVNPVLKHLLQSQINERNCMIIREQLNNIFSELAITRASVVGTRQIC